MLCATIIDALDGTLARWARVHEVLPNFDGRRLDDIIDFQTYTSLPLLLIWRAALLPVDLAWLLLAPLVASAYGFCQKQAKTDDGYFLGFPSYWNVVAFYLFVLRPPVWVCAAILLALSLLTFVPMRYLYPTQPGLLNRSVNVLAFVWVPVLLWILFQFPDSAAPGDWTGGPIWWLALASLFFPIYYLAASFAVTSTLMLRKRSRTSEI